MIARVWKGWASVEDADSYERLLREVVSSLIYLHALKSFLQQLGKTIIENNGDFASSN